MIVFLLIVSLSPINLMELGVMTLFILCCVTESSRRCSSFRKMEKEWSVCIWTVLLGSCFSIWKGGKKKGKKTDAFLLSLPTIQISNWGWLVDYFLLLLFFFLLETVTKASFLPLTRKGFPCEYLIHEWFIECVSDRIFYLPKYVQQLPIQNWLCSI